MILLDTEPCWNKGRTYPDEEEFRKSCISLVLPFNTERLETLKASSNLLVRRKIRQRQKDDQHSELGNLSNRWLIVSSMRKRRNI
jgi:hypothetical protein